MCPVSAPRPCAKPGCPELVARSERYCKEHRRATWREIDSRRGSSTARGYGYRWQTLTRPAALAREPLCRMCRERGLVVVANEVDHIDGDSRNNDPMNLRSLCKSCHSSRTARDQGFGRSPDTASD